MSSNLASFNFNEITPTPPKFNDLQDEIYHLIFSVLDPYERASICSTCKRWYEIIMATKAYWREVEIKEDSSMDEIKTILQVFNTRSENTMTRVQINRFIDTEEELQEIFSLIGPSSSRLMSLSICQNVDLNAQTRQFSRTLPQLGSLYTSEEEDDPEKFRRIDVRRTFTGLKHFYTDILEDIKDGDIQWLSKLEYLTIDTADSHVTVVAVLSSCSCSLKRFVLGTILTQDASLIEPIEMAALENLEISPAFLGRVPVVLPLIAPNLKYVSGGLYEIGAVDAPSLELMFLNLEDEGEEGWNKEKSEEFAREFKRSLSENPRLAILQLSPYKQSCQAQIQVTTQALYWTQRQDQVPLGLHLADFTISGCNCIEDMAGLAERSSVEKSFSSRPTDSKGFSSNLRTRTSLFKSML